jgi:hypothetical protein
MVNLLFYSASPEYPATSCRDEGETNHGEARQSEDGLSNHSASFFYGELATP